MKMFQISDTSIINLEKIILIKFVNWKANKVDKFGLTFYFENPESDPHIVIYDTISERNEVLSYISQSLMDLGKGQDESQLENKHE